MCLHKTIDTISLIWYRDELERSVKSVKNEKTVIVETDRLILRR